MSIFDDVTRPTPRKPALAPRDNTRALPKGAKPPPSTGDVDLRRSVQTPREIDNAIGGLRSVPESDHALPNASDGVVPLGGQAHDNMSRLAKLLHAMASETQSGRAVP